MAEPISTICCDQEMVKTENGYKCPVCKSELIFSTKQEEKQEIWDQCL
jgi:hypothetical protein